MAEDNKIKRCPVSLQPDIESLLAELTPEDFEPASQQERDDFIQDRQSVSYWKDAWRRLKKNTVAMIALGVIIFLFLFAFVGPFLVPYGYDQFSTGAENLYPYHYALEDQTRLDEEIAARSESEVMDVDTLIENAKAEAEAKGETLSSVDIAMIRAKAKVASKGQSEHEDTDLSARNLALRKNCLAIPTKNCREKQQGKKYFRMYLVLICMAVIFWSV